MVVTRTGNATPEKREGRITGRLTVSDPRFESLLAGLGIEGSTLHHVRQFAKMMATAAGRFQIAKRKSGIFGDRRLSRADAARAFESAFQKEHGR